MFKLFFSFFEDKQNINISLTDFIKKEGSKLIANQQEYTKFIDKIRFYLENILEEKNIFHLDKLKSTQRKPNLLTFVEAIKIIYELIGLKSQSRGAKTNFIVGELIAEILSSNVEEVCVNIDINSFKQFIIAKWLEDNLNVSNKKNINVNEQKDKEKNEEEFNIKILEVAYHFYKQMDLSEDFPTTNLKQLAESIFLIDYLNKAATEESVGFYDEIRAARASALDQLSLGAIILSMYSYFKKSSIQFENTFVIPETTDFTEMDERKPLLTSH